MLCVVDNTLQAWDIEQGSPPSMVQPSTTNAYLNVDMHRVDQVVRSLVTNAVCLLTISSQYITDGRLQLIE